MQGLQALKWLLPFIALAVTGCADDEGAQDIAPTPDLTTEERVENFKEDHDDAVGYRNPGTRYKSNYTLDVERDSEGMPDRINFPNGGYEDDFVDKRDNGDGTVTLTDETGREFTVER